ncbi:MAG: ankyrin repeat domain-containing protein [Gammaproteobacteria bacterium]|nr:ankyrin repeat domain-containing protein [Gammaproteobacteria bacterium]MDP2346376.1 ankyrin repeat domain-containing protein [Gammaproteobacteria bacterium]
MDTQKITTLLLWIGSLFTFTAVIWWAYFYDRITQALDGNLSNVVSCLYSSSGPCAIASSLAVLAGATPYDPSVFWIGVVMLGIGLGLQVSSKMGEDKGALSYKNAKQAQSHVPNCVSEDETTGIERPRFTTDLDPRRNIDEFVSILISKPTVGYIDEYFSGMSAEEIENFINLPDACEEYPLHISISKGSTDLVRWLLAAGANPAIKNYWGETPVQIAERRNDQDAVALLKNYSKVQTSLVFDETVPRTIRAARKEQESLSPSTPTPVALQSNRVTDVSTDGSDSGSKENDAPQPAMNKGWSAESIGDRKFTPLEVTLLIIVAAFALYFILEAYSSSLPTVVEEVESVDTSIQPVIASPPPRCQVNDPDINGSYEGGCVNGFANGSGIALGRDRYDGEFLAGSASGIGKYIWGNESDWPTMVHEGRFLADSQYGFGVRSVSADDKSPGNDWVRQQGVLRNDRYVVAAIWEGNYPQVCNEATNGADCIADALFREISNSDSEDMKAVSRVATPADISKVKSCLSGITKPLYDSWVITGSPEFQLDDSTQALFMLCFMELMVKASLQQALGN